MSSSAVAIRPRRSMMLFALLAILMVIASYVFVLLLAAACIYIPYRLSTTPSTGTEPTLLLFFGVLVAGAILWSLFPRFDKFKAPGPQLDRARHPALFAELDDIAASLNEPLPKEVYVVGEVNAWVADRGGILGFGSRRIMGLGLPLMSILTVSQFRAVLAHEFAHYYGGDTSLGPWVYKTKMAILRTFKTVGSLGQAARNVMLFIMHFIVSMILKAHVIVFLRAINLISRRQEFRADELACLVAGPKPLIAGLRMIHAASSAWQAYWVTAVSPVLSCGRIPPIGEGFARFLAAPTIAHQVETIVQKELTEEKGSPYDTHPPLRERIAAAEQLSVPEQQEDMRPASSLLGSSESLELSFLSGVNADRAADKLRSIAWDAVPTEITVPGWRSAVADCGPAFQGITVETLADAVARLGELGSTLRDPKGMLLTPEQRGQRAAHALAASLGLVMLENGWELRCAPGMLHLQRGQRFINPFFIVDQVVQGKISREAWPQKCRDLGLPPAPLFPQVPVPQQV